MNRPAGDWRVAPPDLPDRAQAAIARMSRASWPDAAPFAAYLAELRAPAGADDVHVRVATGAGATDEEARARTMAEAVERFSLIARGDEATTLASVHEVGDAAISLAELPLLSARQMRRAALWNLGHRGRHVLPQAVDSNLRLAWLRPDESLSTCQDLVPACWVLLGHPDRSRAPALAGRSSGAAAGTNLADAAVRGCYELIERDATAIWWYNCLRRPELVIARTGWMADVARWFDRAQRTLHFLDLTHDLGVPVVAAVSFRRDRQVPLFATAAAPTHHEAAESALRELLLTLINVHFLGQTVQRDGWSAIAADAAYTLAWQQSRSADDVPFLLPAGRAQRLRKAARARRSRSTRQWGTLRSGLEKCGLRVLVFDVTRREIGVNVAKVVIPGLRPTLARLAPGRLYDVPVKLGWLKRPRAETRLNADPCPF